MLNKHEDELMFVFGNVTLKGYKTGTYVDVVTLLPSPYALEGNTKCLMQVSPFHNFPDSSKHLQPCMSAVFSMSSVHVLSCMCSIGKEQNFKVHGAKLAWMGLIHVSVTLKSDFWHAANFLTTFLPPRFFTPLHLCMF